MQKLNTDFYNRNDVAQIARELLGKIVVTKFQNRYTSARIVETEAYAGIADRASHAYGGKRTNRTEVMFGKPGVAYVYLCYGIHHMFNIVTNKENVPDAVLIRGVEPLEGIPVMLQRFGKKEYDAGIGRGPGNAGRALGIRVNNSGTVLQDNHFFIGEEKSSLFETCVSRRIGVDYAGDHAKWLYRFFVNNHPQVTKHAINKEAVLLL